MVSRTAEPVAGQSQNRLAPPSVSVAVGDPQATPPCTSPLTPTVFHHAWWLDAVTDGRWDAVEASSGGRVVGRFPFVKTARFGQVLLGMPTLTHFLGPAVDDGDGTPATRLLRRVETTRQLISALPAHAALWMKFHRGVTETLAFQHAGYRNEVQFTCELAPESETELWAGLRDTARRVIRRAADRLDVIEVTDPQAYFAFYTRNLEERGLRNTYREAAYLRAVVACRSHKAGRLLAAVDEDGKLQAGIFTIWDQTSEYYLMSSRRPDADNGATSLLIWAAILHARACGLAFDLDGVSTPGDMQFLTRFGGTIQPRYSVHRSSLLQRGLARVRWRDA